MARESITNETSQAVGARSAITELKSEIQTLKAQVEERDIALKHAKHQETRLSYRVQELKKSMMHMVPKAEITGACG